MTFHHKTCGGVIVDDPKRPSQTFGPYGEFEITAVVQPKKCSQCGFRMPLNIDPFIVESMEDLTGE